MDASKNAVKRATAANGVRRFYEFGAFRLDVNRHRLLRNGEIVALFPKAVETLTTLVQNPGKLLEREELMDAVWPDAVVEDANLTVAISHLRKVLGQNDDSGDFIQTIPRVGYRFVADVREVVEERMPLVDEGNPHGGDAIDAAGENGTGISRDQSPQRRATVPPWPNERRPLSAKTGWLLFAILAIGIAVLTTLFLVRSRTVPNPSPANAPQGRGYSVHRITPIPEKSIAVLPLENLSDEKQNGYFAGGIQDEIISDLAKIADLKVISRTSANLYKSGNPRNSREIGEQLGVAHLLEGSVQRIGNRIRVHAQLIDARTDTHVWTETYDRDVANLFAVQSEISKAIADQLHAQISADVRLAIERPPTTDLTGFELYIRAKNLALEGSYSTNGQANLSQAADLLNQAVAHDPSFFQAYCLLAHTHDLLYFLGFDHTPARLGLAEAAIESAFRLRPNSGEAHLARAENLYRGSLNSDGALAELEIARQTLPNDSRVFELRGYIERRRGNHVEALRSLERAVDLDPRNVLTLQQTGLSYAFLRRYADEAEVLDRALAIQPTDIDVKLARTIVELDWKADTRPLHKLIEDTRAKNPIGVASVSEGWLYCALAERDIKAAESALIDAGDIPLNDDTVQFTRSFIEGVIARMMNDDGKARAAFTAARAEQERLIESQSNNPLSLCVLGLIDAALGRKEQALSEGRRAVELLPVERDTIGGPRAIEYFAMIAAWVGDKDLACDQLASAIRYASRLSYGQLKLMPWWDPLRGDPRFEAIVSSLAPK